MARAWLDNGPISLPSDSVALGAGAALSAFALLGLALGYQASYRRSAAPDPAGVVGQRSSADAIDAKPIVDLAPTPAAPSATKPDADDEDDKTDELAAQTAAAQSIQAKPAKSAANIDDVLTSPSEKPPPAAKAPADEAPPGSPVRSDVPF